jgi:hypothetical protein
MYEDILLLPLINSLRETPVSSAVFVTCEDTDVTKPWARCVDMPDVLLISEEVACNSFIRG